MDFIKIALVILVSIVFVCCLPIYDKSVSYLITITACTLIIIYVVNYTVPVIHSIKLLFRNNLNFDFKIIFKSMGISLITQFISDIANDSGNKALANQMVFVGKAAIIALALPLFSQVLEIIGQLII